jgi:hypothetical protein
MTKLSTDIYLAPRNTPPVEVEALTDASGHLLRLPDGYRWAGTLRDDSDGMAHWERSSRGEEWLSIYSARPLDEVTSDQYFQLLAVTHEFPLHQLVWVVRWLPRVYAVADGGGVTDLTGQHDTALGFTMRIFYVGPGMCSASVRAKLGLPQEHS